MNHYASYMRFMSNIILIFAMIAGCSNKALQKPAVWVVLKIESIKLQMIDVESYLYFGFGKEGRVSVTFGEKSGPLAAPIMYWRLENGHLIISKNQLSEAIWDFHQPEVEGQTLTVKSGFSGTSKFLILEQ